jgi:NitT/TauT family transport system permease protein
MMLVGVGAASVYFLVSIAAIGTIVINTAHGVEKVDQIWVKVAQTLGGTGLSIVRRVLIPAIMPDILTGIRLALGVAWIVIVPAEMLGVASGLGYSILNYRDVTDYSSLMAIILVIGMLGYLSDVLLRLVQRKFAWFA